MRAYPSAPLPVRSPHPYSLGKRRSLRDATWTLPDNTDSRVPACRRLPDKAPPPPSAKSEQHAASIVERTRNHPKSRACMTKRCRPKLLASGHPAPAPVNKLVRRHALHRQLVSRQRIAPLADQSEKQEQGTLDGRLNE